MNNALKKENYSIFSCNFYNLPSSVVSGQSVLEKERKGDYLGKTVQVIHTVIIAITCCFLHTCMDE